MLISLHKQARTTPAVRAEIAASDEPVSVLAQRYNITESTVRKWQARADFNDRSHTPHRLQTTLTPAQEAVVVELRRLLLMPLDDLVAVVKEFIEPKASRSAIHRCLSRHRVNKLHALRPEARQVAHKPFQAYEPGFVHIDVKYLPQMPDETARRYLFVAIDRATRWVFVQIKPHKTARSAAAFLKALSKTCPIKIRKILTENSVSAKANIGAADVKARRAGRSHNGKEFTDRLFGRAARSESGRHEFDQLCQALAIEHRLTRPRRPQTNGMVERFNGRIEEVLRSHHFTSGEDLERTIARYVWLYNHQLPQAALKGQTPLAAMRQWYQSHPHLFDKQPHDLPGLDIFWARLVRWPLCIGTIHPQHAQVVGSRAQ
ncbi:IS481 family transposase [Tibeticola sp.]|uniref:IS481 family transposase n=1 Tax=Tibeticola sp. TaxID=2005368 RepID=UPI00258CB6C6|nr:IS481 family transposase [Tibeticola sp.]